MSLIKPQSAFQHYLKAWKNLTDTQKAPFILMAQRDKNRYEKEIRKKEKSEEEEVKKEQIYLRAYTGGYSAVGLDNGAKSYETVGPVVKIIEYNEEEQKKWGVKVKEFQYAKGSGIYGPLTLYHNQKYHIRTQWGDPNKKGDNVYTHSKTYNHRKDNPYAPIRKYHVCKKVPLYVGETAQHYTSFDNTTWTTNH
jgi:hypothetical protein